MPGYKPLPAMTNQHPECKILVIGKAGNGKSALCNTIVGEEKFAIGHSLSTTTVTAQSEHVQINNCNVKVVDTPDVTNCRMNSREQTAEVLKWNQMTSGDPSAVLLTVRGDVRYTNEEYHVFEEICKLWRGKSLKKRLLVAFTFGDKLDEDIREVVNDPPPELKKILKAAGNRYMVFTNKASPADRGEQARDLLIELQNLDPRNASCPCSVL